MIAAVITLWACNGSPNKRADDFEMADSARRMTEVGGETRAETRPMPDATAAADSTLLPPPDLLWPPGPPPLEWSAWVAQSPWLTDVSTWSFHLEANDQQLEFRYLPDFGVGNGHVFALLGYGQTVNTLHSMSGPYYHKGEGFFGDIAFEIVTGDDEQPLTIQEQWIGRVRRTPVVHTMVLTPIVQVSTTDFAPLPDDPAHAARRAFIRVVTVRNRSDQAVKNLKLALRFARPQEAWNKGLTETRDTRRRWTVALDEPEASATENELLIPLDKLEGRSERRLLVAFIMDDEEQLAEATLAALLARPVEELLEETRLAWEETLAGSTILNSPDPVVNDYLEGQKMVILAQQAYNGSSHPMCEYTRTWLRDNAGPVRFFVRTGLFERARAMLDYLWLAAQVEGSIQNSYFGNYSPDDVTGEPHWDEMPVMTGRTRAESPSYIPLMYSWYWTASGRDDFISTRLSMMRHALEKQDIHDDLLYFSTDETFRTAMAVAHGLDVDEQFDEGFYSANSSFVWVAAAERLAPMAQQVGRTDEAEQLLARADKLRQAAEETYLDESGCYVPYVYVDGLVPAPAPFEDVNTKPLWSGYHHPGDDAALTNLLQTMTALGGDDGILVSPLPDKLKNLFGLPISEGLYTGMSPGYYLSSLALVRHPLAEDAFNALAQHATAGGTTPEYQILDDFSPLHFVYDSLGGVGDYTARFRPWEGGILADAAYEYLLGNRSDGRTHELHLSPSFPNGWSWLEAANLRTGDAFLDVRFQRPEGRFEARVHHRQGPAATIHLSWLETKEPPSTALLDGDPVPLNHQPLPLGGTLVSLDPFQVDPDTERAVKVEPARP